MIESRTSDEIAKRNLAQIQYARMLLIKAAEALKTGIVPQNARDIKQWIEIGIRIEKTALGMDMVQDNKAKIIRESLLFP